MCTVSAFFENNILNVTMSRDEQRTRFEGDVSQTNSLLYPVDAKAGGTWFGANKSGVVMCLLNLYEHENFVGTQSRGFIIPKMLELGSFEAIESALKNSFEHKDYSAFSLLTFNKKTVIKTRWDGQTISHEHFALTPWYFFTSSGLDTINVQKGRNQVFNTWLEKNKTNENVNVPSFHLLYIKGEETKSCFVQRELVHTKSISQLIVEKNRVVLEYYPQAVINDYINEKTINKNQSQTFELLT